MSSTRGIIIWKFDAVRSGVPMRSRQLVIIAAYLLLSLPLVACSPKGDAPSSDAGGSSASTLTKDTLPTEVGTKWTVIRKDVEGTPITLTVEGPWQFSAGEDWSVNEYEIVDPATVPEIEQFGDYTYVEALRGEARDYYYPRLVTDEWVQGLGRIDVGPDEVIAEPQKPAHFWPLQLEVGDTYVVNDDPAQRLDAEVLSRNTATLPAGTIENAYLVRFRRSGTGEIDDTYYLFAPGVGMAAYFHYLEGSEADGFTAAGSVVLLNTMPAKQ